MKKYHLVYLGLSGFPHGMAPIQRQKLIAKSLIMMDWDVTVICNRGVHEKSSGIARRGVVDGIDYEYIFNAERIRSFFKRNLFKFLAPFQEFFVLLRLRNEKGITAAIVTDRNLIWDAIKYRVFSWVLGFKVYINLVELYKDRPNLSPFIRINDVVFNRIGCYFYDGIIPISKYLYSHVESFNKRALLIPIITDTSSFQNIHCDEDNYILYCGSASYVDAINVVLNSFALVKHKELQLVLVVGGSSLQLNHLKAKIKELGFEARTRMKSNISDLELNTLYMSAKALLLPLFDTIQDNARFPHKFGEYLASGTVVVTNKIGEIKHYLCHKENVIFANNSEPEEISKWIDWILENESMSKSIGLKGREVAVNFFDYRVYSESLSSFLLEGK